MLVRFLLALASVLPATALGLTVAPAAHGRPAGLAVPSQEPGEVYGAPLTVRGRLLDAEGNPLAGVEPRLHGWRGNASLEQAFGVPDDWSDPEVPATDAEGRFEVTFRPPNAFVFRLQVRVEGCAALDWSWFAHEHRDTLDLGDATLETEAVLEGHLEGRRGELLVDGWRVSARHRGRLARPRSARSTSATPDPVDGTFRLEGLPPGEVEVSARNGDRRIEGVVVTTRAGEVTHLVLTETGPDPARRIALRVHAEPFGVLERPGSDGPRVQAIGADGRRRDLTRDERTPEGWVAEDLAPGVYTLEVEDPWFVPWRQEDVAAGTSVVAHLRGRASVALSVLDAEGRPLPRAAVHATRASETTSVRELVLVAPGQRLPADGVLDGLVPGSWTLRVVPEDGAPALARVTIPGPEDRVPVQVQVGRARRLSGRVLDADGRPVAGVMVQHTWGDVAGHSGNPAASSRSALETEAGTTLVVVPYRDAECVTDAEGRFAFEDVKLGPNTLCVLPGTWSAVQRVVHVGLEDEVDRDLVLPPLGALRVTPIGWEDRADLELSVTAEPADASGVQRFLHRLEHVGNPGVRVPVQGDGPWRLEPLPAGPVEVRVAVVERTETSVGRSPLFRRRVEVVRGRTLELELDLRGRAPASGSVRLSSADLDLEGARLSFVHDPEPAPLTGFVPVERVAGSFVHRGAAKVHALPPGRVRAVLTNFGQGWEWWSAPFDVAPGSTLDLALEVPCVRRTVRVLDGDGRPRAGASIAWVSRGLELGRGQAWTDAEGRVELRLPPGPYHVRLVPDREAARPRGTEFEGAALRMWPPVGDGDAWVLPD